MSNIYFVILATWFFVFFPLQTLALDSDDDGISDACDVTPLGSSGPFQKIQIQGESWASNGIYDPSIDYDSSGVQGWLAYTAVSGNRQFVQTHIARTTDHGATWSYIARANQATESSLVLPVELGGGTRQGTWVYEVPSLLRDSTEPNPNKRWKLFTHKYFRLNDLEGTRYPPSFTIVLQTAATPAGPWSSQISLFKAASGIIAAEYVLNSLNTQDLGNMLFFSEPGALALGGSIYLSLSGGRNQVERIILLKSSDHAVSWNYQGTLAKNRDAAIFGDSGLDGSAFFKVADKLFLLTTQFRSSVTTSPNNNGTYLFEVADIETAQLRRDSTGELVRLLHIELQPGLNSGNHGGGQASYHSFNTAGGILMPQISLADSPEFAQIFSTKVNPKRLPLINEPCAGAANTPRNLRIRAARF